LAKEGDTLVQIVSTEAVLSWQHPQAPTQDVHAQTIGAEPEAIQGEPGATEWQPGDPSTNTPKGVAHAEPDSTPGEVFDPNANAPVHLEGAGLGFLMDAEEDRPYVLEEDGIAWENASVEEDRDPRIELQEPGVSHLAMPEEDMFLTSSLSSSSSSSSSSSPITPKTASMQCSPAIDTEMPATPEPDYGMDLEPQPHDRLPPNEATEPPIHQSPEQIQAPTDVEGPLESFRGETLQRTMGQMSPASVHAPEGMMPTGEAHGRPPDLPNPQTQGSIAWEPASIIPKGHVCMHKAWRPILDKGACTRPNLWPSLDSVIVDPDIYFGSASRLEGEQNLFSPYVGSEQYASPCTPQISPSLSSPSPVSSPLDTLARENLSCGEGSATKQHTTETWCPEPLKLPDTHGGDLQETGGVPSVPGNSPVFPENIGPFGLAGADKNADAGGVKPLGIDADKRGGVPLLMGAAPALVEGAAGVGPAGRAETATTAEPEVLAPWAQDKAGCGHEVDMPPREALPQKGKHNPKALSRKRERRPNNGEHEPIRLQGEAP